MEGFPQPQPQWSRLAKLLCSHNSFPLRQTFLQLPCNKKFCKETARRGTRLRNRRALRRWRRTRASRLKREAGVPRLRANFSWELLSSRAHRSHILKSQSHVQFSPTVFSNKVTKLQVRTQCVAKIRDRLFQCVVRRKFSIFICFFSRHLTHMTCNGVEWRSIDSLKICVFCVLRNSVPEFLTDLPKRRWVTADVYSYALLYNLIITWEKAFSYESYLTIRFPLLYIRTF